MVAMIPTEINGRWTLLLPEHRAARPEWATGWERERLDSMHEHLTALRDSWVNDPDRSDLARYRPVIVDVGVEEGDLTALYSQWGCDVVMVEPNPRVWPNVRAIWQANNLRAPLEWWVGFAGDHDDWLHHVEWANENNGVQPYEGERWPRCAHGPVIGDHAFLHLAQHPHVPSVMLDTLTGGGIFRPIKVDAITMDVEGSELTVLRGAERILREDRPLVWVSVHTDEQWMDENYPLDGRDAVVEHMDARGYDGTLLAIDHEEHWFFEPRPLATGGIVRPGSTYIVGERGPELVQFHTDQEVM